MCHTSSAIEQLVKLAAQQESNQIITIEVQEVEDASVADESSPTPPPSSQQTQPVPAASVVNQESVSATTNSSSTRPTVTTSPPNTMTGNRSRPHNCWKIRILYLCRLSNVPIH
ncbi:hypothetical protein ABEB36_003258 [Hypothenemus hampei]|uniref:Uncharacterized protein n=1 Tax=Hypothenemus hampei TaxID=57062 RepID=A0ABD1FB77_HYPHA